MRTAKIEKAVAIVNDGELSSAPDTVTVTVRSTGDPADINGDGNVDAIDVQKCINQALGLDRSPGDGLADMNGDLKVDAIDVQMVINKALGLEVDAECDLSGEGSVNAVDVQLVINAVLGISGSVPDDNMFTKLVSLSP